MAGDEVELLELAQGNYILLALGRIGVGESTMVDKQLLGDLCSCEDCTVLRDTSMRRQITLVSLELSFWSWNHMICRVGMLAWSCDSYRNEVLYTRGMSRCKA